MKKIGKYLLAFLSLPIFPHAWLFHGILKLVSAITGNPHGVAAIDKILSGQVKEGFKQGFDYLTDPFYDHSIELRVDDDEPQRENDEPQREEDEPEREEDGPVEENNVPQAAEENKPQIQIEENNQPQIENNNQPQIEEQPPMQPNANENNVPQVEHVEPPKKEEREPGSMTGAEAEANEPFKMIGGGNPDRQINSIKTTYPELSEQAEKNIRIAMENAANSAKKLYKECEYGGGKLVDGGQDVRNILVFRAIQKMGNYARNNDFMKLMDSENALQLLEQGVGQHDEMKYLFEKKHERSFFYEMITNEDSKDILNNLDGKMPTAVAKAIQQMNQPQAEQQPQVQAEQQQPQVQVGNMRPQ